MTKTPTIHIDLDQALEMLRLGIRRSDIFMGVGLNASEHDPPISHVLAPDDVPQIHLVKEELNEDEKAHVAQEFGKWIRASGIRELLETFSIFMHGLYSIIFLIRQHQRQIDKKLNKCRPEKFERMGIGDQIEKMSEVVAVPDNNIRIIRSLNKARNCYAHRRGLVGPSDLDEGTDAFNILWNTLQVQVREDDGNVVSGKEMIGKRFERGGAIELVVKERSKAFAAGKELVLEKHELKEMCLSVLSIGQNLFKETVAVAKGAGILTEKIDSNLEDPKPV